MSYANVIMYGSVLPRYGDKEGKGDVIKADDPQNREAVRGILFG
jgi:hypothetical protein